MIRFRDGIEKAEPVAPNRMQGKGAGEMSKRVITFIFVLTLIGFHFSNATYGNQEQSEKEPSETATGDYIIYPGDILEIVTWKEPDFTKEVIVRNDGKFSFPLLDDISAENLTTVQVKKTIEKGLKEYVDNPVVTVILKSPQSQKYYILGEIQKTGEYQIAKRLTVLQAFALAGGFTEWASKKEIILLRVEQGRQKIYRINYKDIIKGKDLDQNVIVKPDDTIIVP